MKGYAVVSKSFINEEIVVQICGVYETRQSAEHMVEVLLEDGPARTYKWEVEIQNVNVYSW